MLEEPRRGRFRQPWSEGAIDLPFDAFHGKQREILAEGNPDERFELDGFAGFARAVDPDGVGVEAPGEAPSKATNDESADSTVSVPNSNTPIFFWSFLIICTRCPAISSYQL